MVGGFLLAGVCLVDFVLLVVCGFGGGLFDLLVVFVLVACLLLIGCCGFDFDCLVGLT